MPEREITRQTEPYPKDVALTIMAHSLMDYYFDPKPWEKRGKIYEWLGINWFKRMIPDTGDKKSLETKKQTGKYLHINSHSYSELYHHERQTRINEAIHLGSQIPFAWMTDLGFGAGGERGLGLGILALALNLGVNIYPIMAARYTRTRLYRAMELRHQLDQRPDPIKAKKNSKWHRQHRK